MADSIPSISAAGSSPQKTVGTKLRKTSKSSKPKTKTTKTTDTPHGIPTSGPRLEQWLANPGLRSKLPDSALTADQLAQRQLNQRLDAPAAPGSSYTNRQLSQLLTVLERQKFGGEQATLDQRGQAVPAWFGAYRKTLADAQAAERAAAAQHVASIQNMAAQAAAAPAQLQGAPQVNGDIANAAAAIRSAGIGNQAALAQTLAGNQDNYLTNQNLLSYGSQAGALSDLANARQQLAQQRGDFRITQRQQILSDEADAALKNALTQAQVGSTNANATSATANADKTQAEIDFFNKHGYWPQTGPTKKPKAEEPYSSGPFAGYTPSQVKAMSDKRKAQLKADYKPSKTPKKETPVSGPGSLTPAKEQEIVSKINKIYQALVNAQIPVKDAAGNTTFKKVTPRQMAAYLRAQNVDPRELDVARSLFHNNGKGVGQMGVDAAHDLGIHVGNRWQVIR